MPEPELIETTDELELDKYVKEKETRTSDWVEKGILDPITKKFMKGHSRTGGVTKLRDCDAIKGIVFDQTKRKWKELAQLIWDKALGGDHKYIQLILAYKLGKPTELLETKQNIDIKAGLISDASLSREDELAKVLEKRSVRVLEASAKTI